MVERILNEQESAGQNSTELAQPIRQHSLLLGIQSSAEDMKTSQLFPAPVRRPRAIGAGTPACLHESSSGCFLPPILPCCFLLGLWSVRLQRNRTGSPAISAEISVFPSRTCNALVNENQHEWSQLCPHLRCRYAQTPGSQDLIWSENPHSQCILKTEPQSQSIETIQILAVSG